MATPGRILVKEARCSLLRHNLNMTHATSYVELTQSPALGKTVSLVSDNMRQASTPALTIHLSSPNLRHASVLTKTISITQPQRRHASTLAQSASLSHQEERPYRDIPGPRGLYRLPILGTLLNYKPFTEFTAESNHQLLKEMYNCYGPLFRLQLGVDTVVVADPADIETVYLSEGRYPRRPNLGLREVYAKRSGIKCMDVATLIPNVVRDRRDRSSSERHADEAKRSTTAWRTPAHFHQHACDEEQLPEWFGCRSSNYKERSSKPRQGDEWHSVRNPLNKRLVKVDSAAYYLQPQSFVAEDFAQVLANQQFSPEELSRLFFRFASESIGVVCFNKRLGFLDEREVDDPETRSFLQATKDAFAMLHKSFTGESIAYSLYRNKTYRKYEEAIGIISRFSRKQLLQAKDVLNTQVKDGTLISDEPNLLLSLFSDKTLHEDHVVQVVESLYSGGTDSTAGSVQALFYNLAKNPDKQEKLRQEVNSLMPLGRPVTVDILNKMHYLKACVKESFRILYPSNGILRILPNDVVLSGYRVPAGTQIMLCNILTCLNEFPDSDQYIPERWLRSAEGHRADDMPKMAVLPFGYGPRNCVGRRFAEQEVYLAAIKVLQRMKIGLEPQSWNTPFVFRIFLQPSSPLSFTFT